MFEYVLDNNEIYREDSSEFSIFSMEEIDSKEFEEIVNHAYDLCLETSSRYGASYAEVARKIIEIDKRFFVPTLKSIAFVGHENNEHISKVRGFRHS